MRDMFFGNIPEWQKVLAGIKTFEDDFNK